MISRKNEIVFVCLIVGIVLATLVDDGLDAPPLVSTTVLVFTAAVLPMVINNHLESEKG
ncbi:MAG: hypothetical protein ACQET5_10990 [Halobacteriota archaeon]|uniref:hypothetical protein n=1 Tax=Natronomonas sp. TaxID=2184060 RepID=UPI00397682C0